MTTATATQDRGDELLTVAEVRAILRLGHTATYEAIARGRLPAIRLPPRSIRVRRRDLEAWIEEHRQRGPFAYSRRAPHEQSPTVSEQSATKAADQS